MPLTNIRQGIGGRVGVGGICSSSRQVLAGKGVAATFTRPRRSGGGPRPSIEHIMSF